MLGLVLGFDMLLPADEREFGNQFQQQSGDVMGDGGFNSALVGFLERDGLRKPVPRRLPGPDEQAPDQAT